MRIIAESDVKAYFKMWDQEKTKLKIIISHNKFYQSGIDEV